MIPKENLRLGNFVLYNGMVCRVSIVSENGSIGLVDGGKSTRVVTEKDIDPILITRKILEENRFIRHQSPAYPEHFSYELPANHMVFRVFGMYDTDFSFNINNTAMNIKYVHELQHVLRLCKIDKEVKL